MDIEDKILKRHEEVFVEARVNMDQSRSRFQELIRAAYVQPEKAIENIEAFRQEHGNEALYAKFEDGNDLGVWFGRRRGSILNGGVTPRDVAQRKTSDEARRELPSALREFHENVRKANIAKATYEEAQRAADRRAAPTPTPDDAIGGWSRRYAKRRANEMLAAGQQPPERQEPEPDDGQRPERSRPRR